MEILQILNEFNVISIIVRLFLAIILGGIIGLDREKRTRSAGFRTHSFVCLGATLVMLIGNYLHINFPGGDVARLGAQVINGIGFLGAGAIITSGSQKVRGLTTAAALWTCACIGLAIGIGFYIGAFATCVLSILLLKVLRIVDQKFREREHFFDLYVEIYKSEQIANLINFFNQNGIQIVSLDSVHPKVATSEIGIQATVKISRHQKSDFIINELLSSDFITFAHKVYI